MQGQRDGKSLSRPFLLSCPVQPSFPAGTTTRNGNLDLEFKRIGFKINNVVIRALADKSLGDPVDEEEDDDLCPVDCVQEFKTDEEFLSILEKAKKTNSLVVVDFYRTSCGSCKYIERAFSKLCKGSGDEEAPVIFLKHNVMDEYDEQSEVAERLRIRVVPLFHFYKDGVLLEAFPTRDKEKIIEAIHRSITNGMGRQMHHLTYLTKAQPHVALAEAARCLHQTLKGACIKP
ncbi:hypothetical protein Nepgr_025076 [Nepenthes gracilis]|uniref:Thioredoxin domain-containing protein n=1 Tax=Nepenthes gracilis TaxID=150966 RepID=A0AAD3XZD1_NEPGR|nr:hypothetical protein Nepgr_025076 [Nepenthes gracilis]